MSKAKAPRVFVPLYKVDEEQRLVYGRITAQEVDQSGEVMDYETSKPNFEKWSNDIHEASGGLSKGNLRVMHGLTVAGKLTDLTFDDDEQSIDVCSKVVDDAEWNKVLEGCYTGFSVGGRYGKKWKDTVDGNTIQKYTAIPNEVSLVDNPCVKSATFSLVKADGAEELVKFQNPGDLAKAEEGQQQSEEADEVEQPKQAELDLEPSNSDVVAKAEQMAADASDGSTWMQHVEAARTELMTKAVADDTKKKKKDKGSDNEDEAAEEAAGKDNDAEEGTEGDKSSKVTAPGIKQVWTSSDGKTFEKKADASAHEATLMKTDEVELTEADKLKARLEKALEAPETSEALDLVDDYDRLGKAVQILETVAGGFEPDTLQKGMYTVSRFANVLWDLGSLCRKIAKEGVSEGDDKSDKAVAEEIKTSIASLGDSFKVYVDNQLTELLAGIDDDVCVETYDYYYRASQEDGENQLAKDVCSLIGDRREAAGERRETLTKAFTVVAAEIDEVSPVMQKRFDDLQASNEELKKVAVEAVEKVEEFAKRLKAIEDTPNPPSPRDVAWRDGDAGFFGKKASTEEERREIMQDMLKTYTPDQLADMMIKASHATGGVKLHLNR